MISAINTRYIAIYVGSATPIQESVKDYPGVELYFTDGADVEHQIDLALLNNLHCPVKLAFVGGNQAEHFANLYHGTWIRETPTVEEELIRFWEN